MDLELINQTLTEGVKHQLNGETTAARNAYETVLTDTPNHADAHHLLGVLCIQEGDTQTALAQIQQAIDLNGSVADYHLNLGGAHFLQEHWSQAAEAYAVSARIDPGIPQAHKGFGAASQRLGNLREAADAYQRSLELDVDQGQVFLDLALILEQLEDTHGAIAVLQQACRLNSLTVEPHIALARLYEQTGSSKNAATAWYNVGVGHQSAHETDQALEAFKNSVRLDPEQRTANFFMAMLRGETIPAPPLDYVLDLFNQYAPRFDQHLDRLDYRVPEQLHAAVAETVSSADQPSLRIVDLGCGTGKCGAQFRSMARHLTGVDLAPNMIAIARQHGLYDELTVGNMIDYLRNMTDQADLVLAADVFIYTGDLTEVFHESHRVLPAHGSFAFSVESCPGDTYQLQSTGRYAHSEAYIKIAAAQAGFEVTHMDHAIVRNQGKKPVEGYLVILRKTVS